MASSSRSDSIVRIFARMTSVLPAAATSRSRYIVTNNELTTILSD